jgi:Cell division protein CrgA
MAKSSAKPKPNPKKSVGRYVDPVARGRVTTRRPANADKSPRWYGWSILGLLIVGILVITLNYLSVLPGSTSAWYLALGLVSIFAAFALATGYK